MSAETLRRAAAKARTLAEAATPGPWQVHTRGVLAPREPHDLGRGPQRIAQTMMPYRLDRQTANAVYIASMHPAVALAVADWLDRSAAWADVCGYDVVQPTDPPSYERAVYDAALAVARAYLGEDS